MSKKHRVLDDETNLRRPSNETQRIPVPRASLLGDTLPRILVVDNDPSQLRTLRDILIDEGFSTHPCTTAHDAIRAAADREYVAAVIDVSLPDQQGTRIVEQLRAVDERIRVIIHTGQSSFVSAKDAVNCGAFAFVEKRGDPAELIRHVHRARAEHVREYATVLEQAVAHRSAALRESESRLRAIVEAALDAIVVVTADGIIDTFNPAAERMFDHAASTVCGKGVDLLFTMEHRALLDRAYRQPDTGMRAETMARRRDGSTFPVDLAISVMQAGGRRLFVEIVRDLSSQKKAEEQRQRLEKQMRQAQKMEALGTLAGGVAHDFNNILMGIRGFVDLTLTTVTADSVEAANLMQVIQLTERASGLVKQILAFSRKRDQKRGPLDLRKVVDEILSLVRVMVPKSVEIKHTPSIAPAIVLADDTELHQVLMNLCSNAAHAMRDQGGMLSLSVEPVELNGEQLGLPPGMYLRLSVCDTGHGMTPEVRERIFDPFFTTKEAGVGTGMGLAVVLGIVEGLGGKIAVQSEPGKGARFDVYLPRVGEQPVRLSRRTAVPAGGGKGRILLVDDEAFILNWASILLRRLGYEVEPFSNSVEALERFRADPTRFDLLVTDQTMPRRGCVVRN